MCALYEGLRRSQHAAGNMGFIVIIPIAALAAWSIFAIFRWLRRGDFGAQWLRTYSMLATAGLALGIWFAFFFHYKVANVKLEGFPIPVKITSREKPDAPWVTSNMPLPIRIGGLVTNVLSGMAICLAPIAAAAFLKENRGKGPFTNPNSP